MSFVFLLADTLWHRGLVPEIIHFHTKDKDGHE